MDRKIAYCGIACAECDAYKATQNNDDALRKKVADDWSKMFHITIAPETINCTSCKGDGVKIENCSDCGVRACASAKNFVNCGACGELKTCETIKGFLEHSPSLMDNLMAR